MVIIIIITRIITIVPIQLKYVSIIHSMIYMRVEFSINSKPPRQRASVCVNLFINPSHYKAINHSSAWTSGESPRRRRRRQKLESIVPATASHGQAQKKKKTTTRKKKKKKKHHTPSKEREDNAAAISKVVIVASGDAFSSFFLEAPGNITFSTRALSLSLSFSSAARGD